MDTRSWTWELAFSHVAASEARGLVRSVMTADTCNAALVEEAGLVVSEIVTNAVIHGDAPVVLSLINRGPRWHIRVHDSQRRGPDPRDSVPTLGTHSDGTTGRGSPNAEYHESGRGMHIVSCVAARWGVDYFPGDGKDVWADLEALRQS